MLGHFQPFIDYKKLIEMQANGTFYQISRKSIQKSIGKTQKQQGISSKKIKVLKIGKK